MNNEETYDVVDGKLCRPKYVFPIKTFDDANRFIDIQLENIRAQVGDKKVMLALSGGVDSSVVAALLLKAIDQQLVCVHVNHGLMREGESESVLETFRKNLGANLIYVNASTRYLDKLRGVADPEEKRLIIGEEFINIFKEEADKIDGVAFLAQGTIWPDIVESHEKNKSHHNVGGLPAVLGFELVEPLKHLYKDEVRIVGEALGLPHDMVYRQPFPGPGLGVRCLGAITRPRMQVLREADAILREEFEKRGFNDAKIAWQYFTVLPEFKSVGVRNGIRVEGYSIIIRSVVSTDAMTATVSTIPVETLIEIGERITREIKSVCRVLYDLTPKPVATIEWE